LTEVDEETLRNVRAVTKKCATQKGNYSMLSITGPRISETFAK